MKICLFPVLILCSSISFGASRICFLNSTEFEFSWALLQTKKSQTQRIGSWQVPASLDLAQYSCQKVSENLQNYSVVIQGDYHGMNFSCSLEALLPDDIVRIKTISAKELRCELLKARATMKMKTPAVASLKYMASSQSLIPYDPKTVYFLPVPLANKVLSKEVEVYSLTRMAELDLQNPIKQITVNADLNQMGLHFLQSLDGLLAKYENQIAIVDDKFKTHSLRDLQQIKKIMARTLAGTITPLLKEPEVSSKDDPKIFDSAITSLVALYNGSVALSYSEVPLAMTLQDKRDSPQFPLVRKYIPPEPRAYGDAVSPMNVGSDLRLKDLHWAQYAISYDSPQRWQDSIFVKIVDQPIEKDPLLTEGPDLFNQLVAVNFVMPHLNDYFDKNLSVVTEKSDIDDEKLKIAKNSLEAFIKLSIFLPQAWLDWATGRMVSSQKRQPTDSWQAEIQEGIWKNQEGQDLFLITVKSLKNQVLPQIEGYDTVAGPFEQTYIFYGSEAYLTAAQSFSNIKRRLIVKGIDAFKSTAPRAILQTVRNQNLEEKNSTREAYRLVSSLSQGHPTPMILRYDQEISLGKEASVGPQKLATLISIMLQNLFGLAENNYRMQVSIAYVVPAAMPIQVPVALFPATEVQIPADLGVDCEKASSFSCQMTTALKKWSQETHPDPQGQFVFDISVFAEGPAPLVRASNVTLKRQQIGDL